MHSSIYIYIYIDRREPSYLSFPDPRGLVACKLREEVDAEIFATTSLLNQH